MRKLIAIVLAVILVLSLGACGTSPSDNKGNSSGESSVPSQTNTNSNKGENSAGKTVYGLKDHVVVDNDSCSMTLSDIKESSTKVEFKFVCENKSDKKLMFSADGIVINGYAFTDLFAEEVASGKKSSETLSFSKSSLKDCGIDSVDRLSFLLRIYDSDDWMAEALVKDVFVLYPTGKTDDQIIIPDRKTGSGEQIILDNEYGMFVIYGAHDDSIWGYTVSAYILNRTDSSIMVSWDDVSVNGFMCDPFWANSVPAGASEYTEISFSKSSFKDNGIENVEGIEFTLKMHDAGDFMKDDYVDETFVWKP